jgi:phenylacetate-CoA ligase
MTTDPLLMATTLATRVRVRQRDRWDRTRVLAFQSVALGRLLRHARTNSPYYREALRGAPDLPLTELPILTKPRLMEQWDQICTSDALRLSEVEGRLAETELAATDPGQAWRGRWWLAATGGTTGRRAVFAWNRQEWTQVLTSYARVNDWAGVSVGLRHPLRTALVSSLNPTHQSAVVGASLRSHLVPALRLDARTPMADLVGELDRFEPRLLVAYASMVGPLAQAQLSGQLHIRPEKVVAASEVLTPDARAAARAAWGDSVVVDSYVTETASIASTCSQGGWHLCEDFVIVEPVDEDYRPVPAGVTADRVLVTVLFSRTLPLIRYELTDSIRLSRETLPLRPALRPAGGGGGPHGRHPLAARPARGGPRPPHRLPHRPGGLGTERLAGRATAEQTVGSPRRPRRRHRTGASTRPGGLGGSHHRSHCR